LGTVSISGKSFNIYGNLTDDTVTDSPQAVSATTYFIGQLNTTAWDAADSTTRSKALVTATQILDKQRWVGTPTDVATPQPLAWPRTGVSDCEGTAVPSDEVPLGIVNAAYELAGAILTDATVQSQASGGSNTKRTKSRDKVGDLETERETEYFGPTNIPGTKTGVGRFPTAVQEYVRCFLSGGSLSLVTIEGARDSSFYGQDWGYSGEGLP